MESHNNSCFVIKLNPGVSKINYTALLLASFTVMFNVSLSIVLVTYLLEDAYGVAEDRVGKVSGNVGMISEVGGLVAELSLGYL